MLESCISCQQVNYCSVFANIFKIDIKDANETMPSNVYTGDNQDQLLKLCIQRLGNVT